jgi:hypothetical protein
MNPSMFDLIAKEKFDDLKRDWQRANGLNQPAAPKPGFLVRLSNRITRLVPRLEPKEQLSQTQIPDCT